MFVKSRLVGKNIYQADNGEKILIYAPLKDLVVRGWKATRFLQLFILKLIPDKFTIPGNVLKPTVLELDLGHRCSLNCIYCSVNSNDTDRKIAMPFQLAKIAIDRVFEAAREALEPFAIVFIGKGEPTLNWNTLVKCVEYIKSQKTALGVNGKTIIVTNGIVSPEKAKWLAKNIDHIALSWDGAQDVQDFQRPIATGKGSFELVERTAQVLKREGAYFEIRATWTTRNVGRMVEFTKMFIFYHPFELNYQPLLAVGRAKGVALPKPEVDAFVEGFLKSRSIAAEHGVKVMMPSVEVDRLNRKFCHAYEGSGFHLTADGLVTACECVFSEDDGVAGKYLTYGKIIDGEISVDKGKLNFLKSLSADNIPGCGECFARWHCAGGCMNTHLSYSDNPLEKRSHQECEITKQIVWRLLEEKLH